MAEKKKKKKWIRFRHKVIQSILKVFIAPFCRLKYNIKIEKFKEQGKKPYLILYNHQTPFDQFFVGIAFRTPIYYLATEDIFSLGWISSVIRYIVAPIPIKKQTTDVSAVMNCIRVAREGGSLAIAPEGNRTYSGKTEYMNPAIATLAKKIGLPIAIFRIEGGYGSEPRWSDKLRRGSMKAYVHSVIEPEEYKDMTAEELLSKIEEGLYVNEAVADGVFESERRAEYLERAIYVCPFCGLSEFESHGNESECKKCHRKITYGKDKRISGIGFDFPFEFVNEWYEYQNGFINSVDLTENTEEALYTDRARIFEVIVYSHKECIRKEAEIKLFGDRVVFDEGTENKKVLLFSEISAASVLGRNKLNIYHDGKVYQLKGSVHFNAIKYVNLYYRYKNITRGEENGKFLGL